MRQKTHKDKNFFSVSVLYIFMLITWKTLTPHDHIISLRGEVRGHDTSLAQTLF
jgi:hypothetical protein